MEKCLLEEENLEEKKKKKPYSSVTYTMGDIQKNIDHFNKMLGGKEDSFHQDGYLNGTIKASSPDGASCVTDTGGISGEGGGMGESLELDEDSIHVTRLKLDTELPPEIKLLPQEQIEKFIDTLAPEQEFTVGYVNAIFFYKDLWDKLPIYKCTEMEGYTGVDFEGSADSEYTDKEARIQRASDEIAKSKATGKTFQVGSTVDYSMQNKLVNRGKSLDAATNSYLQRNTILFYPSSAPRVCYFVKLPDADHFIKVTTEQLEKYIYSNLNLIKLRVTPDTARKTIHRSLYGETDQDIDKQTANGVKIDPKYIYKYQKDKLGVRALYTNQIYYLSLDTFKTGSTIVENLTEAGRVKKRYYMKPQNLWLANKDEVLKALIDHELEDCAIYSLIRLNGERDVSKLNSDDIIYYYEDGILYDKNHVRIMDYVLSIKHEEERPHINPETTSDAKLADVYADRMTSSTDLDEAFDLAFDEVDVYGNLLTEEKENTCCICGEEIHGYGNNAAPYAEGTCCDACNLKFVIPARLAQINSKEEK